MFIGDGDGFVWVIAGMTIERGERGGGGGLEDGLGRVNVSGMKLKSRQLLLCLKVAKSFKMLLFPYAVFSKSWRAEGVQTCLAAI
jgi:hypothetical protein